MMKRIKNFNGKQFLKKATPYLLTALMVALCCASMVTGYGCDVWDKGQTTAKDVYTNVRNLSTYVAGAMFVIALLIAMFSKDQRKTDMAIDWAKKIFVIYLVILGAGWIFQWGKELMSDAPDIFG